MDKQNENYLRDTTAPKEVCEPQPFSSGILVDRQERRMTELSEGGVAFGIIDEPDLTRPPSTGRLIQEAMMASREISVLTEESAALARSIAQDAADLDTIVDGLRMQNHLLCSGSMYRPASDMIGRLLEIARRKTGNR